MFDESLPNQMPKLWVGAFAANSATSVGMLEANPGDDDEKMPAELWSVLTFTWPGVNTESTMVCRLCSLPGAGPISDGATGFGTNGAAKTATLAVRPSD